MEFIKPHLDEVQAMTNENMGRRPRRGAVEEGSESRGVGCREGVKTGQVGTEAKFACVTI